MERHTDASWNHAPTGAQYSANPSCPSIGIPRYGADHGLQRYFGRRHHHTRGVSRKTFYQYYAWREDIFVEACDDVVRRYTASMAAAEEDATQDSVAFYRRFFEFFAKEERYVERILCDPSYSVYRARIVAGCAASNRRHQDAFEKMTEEERAASSKTT